MQTFLYKFVHGISQIRARARTKIVQRNLVCRLLLGLCMGFAIKLVTCMFQLTYLAYLARYGDRYGPRTDPGTEDLVIIIFVDFI